MWRIFASAVLAISLTGCQTIQSGQSISDYCEENRSVCLLIGAAIVGGAIAIVKHHNKDDSRPIVAAPAAPAPAVAAPAPVIVGNASDVRLKENIRLVETLDNGIRLHAFQYKGDPAYFVGVLAQEIAEMPQYANAVSTHKSGYLIVNYAKLGLKVLGADQMNRASEAVLSRAEAL